MVFKIEIVGQDIPVQEEIFQSRLKLVVDLLMNMLPAEQVDKVTLIIATSVLERITAPGIEELAPYQFRTTPEPSAGAAVAVELQYRRYGFIVDEVMFSEEIPLVPFMYTIAHEFFHLVQRMHNEPLFLVKHYLESNVILQNMLMTVGVCVIEDFLADEFAQKLSQPTLMYNDEMIEESLRLFEDRMYKLTNFSFKGEMDAETVTKETLDCIRLLWRDLARQYALADGAPLTEEVSNLPDWEKYVGERFWNEFTQILDSVPVEYTGVVGYQEAIAKFGQFLRLWADEHNIVLNEGEEGAVVKIAPLYLK